MFFNLGCHVQYLDEPGQMVLEKAFFLNVLNCNYFTIISLLKKSFLHNLNGYRFFFPLLPNMPNGKFVRNWHNESLKKILKRNKCIKDITSFGKRHDPLANQILIRFTKDVLYQVL